MTEPTDVKYAVVLPFGHGAHWGHEHSVQVHSHDGGATWESHTNLVDTEAVDGVVVPFGAGSRQALQNIRRVTSEDGVTWWSHDAES